MSTADAFALMAIAALLGVVLPVSVYLTVTGRRAERAHVAQLARIADADKIAAKAIANVAGFGRLGKEANR